MFFDSWMGVLRTAVVGVLAYAGLVILLRISGKRTLSKMNAFDLVVTVALGSTLASIILSKDVALAEGMAAFLVLVGMQYVVAWLSVRSRTVRRLVKSEPRLLVHQGCPLEQALRDERVTEDEVRSAVRSQGINSLDQVTAVVLETDGTFSIIKNSDHETTALLGVKGAKERVTRSAD